MTLKNLGRAAIVVIVLLVAANLLSEMRRTHDGDYGRLFNREMRKSEPVVPRTVEVVREAPAIADREAADPLLLAPAAREAEYLDTTGAQPDAEAATASRAGSEAARGPVAIVGDQNGVAVVGTKRVLGGGFGR